MNEDTLIPESEVKKIVYLLGKIATMKCSASTRRRALMNGLAMLVEADAWSWIVSRAADDHNNPAVASILHGGLTDEQFARFVQIMQDRKNTPVEYKVLNKLRLTKKRFTRTWDQLVSAEEWYSAKNREILEAVGFEHILYCVKVLDNDGLFSGIALKRQMGRPNFTPLQRRIAHIVTGEIGWLHYDEKLAKVTQEIQPLPPRLRTVLTLLIEGHSIREIALKLERGYYTIKDNAKDIYKHFKVKNRAGLFRHFMAGDGQDVN